MADTIATEKKGHTYTQLLEAHLAKILKDTPNVDLESARKDAAALAKEAFLGGAEAALVNKGKQQADVQTDKSQPEATTAKISEEDFVATQKAKYSEVLDAVSEAYDLSEKQLAHNDKQFLALVDKFQDYATQTSNQSLQTAARKAFEKCKLISYANGNDKPIFLTEYNRLNPAQVLDAITSTFEDLDIAINGNNARKFKFELKKFDVKAFKELQSIVNKPKNLTQTMKDLRKNHDKHAKNSNLKIKAELLKRAKIEVNNGGQKL
ncbi:MAG: hypothetical protein LBM38_01235 [Clostridiales bacterium]|jgi:hypothetical protein|nr:hypothetical protein [Clostridiales bacterium]